MISDKIINSSIYLGNRGAEFKALIKSLLLRGRLKAKYINLLINDKNMKLFGKAFTAQSANPKDNYEIYEQLGDVSANKFIVWYSYRRFPQLECPEGVKVVARLRINYGAKQSFSRIAESLGFWPFITAAEDGTDRSAKYRSRHKKDLLEDCLEAFVGCTEQILDREYRPGVGYAIVYDILSNIFDKINISLRYEDLIDDKTRMKEIFDAFSVSLGSFYFIDKREDKIVKSSLYQIPPGQSKQPKKQKIGNILYPSKGWIKIGEGIASKKSDAQQKASAIGIKTLNSRGFVKKVPLEYRIFCK